MVLCVEDELPRLGDPPADAVDLLPCVSYVVRQVVLDTAGYDIVLCTDYASPAAVLVLVGGTGGRLASAYKPQVVVAQVAEGLGGAERVLR